MHEHPLQRILWLLGLGSAPRLTVGPIGKSSTIGRCTGGCPLLAVTGVMLAYPLTTNRVLPGWNPQCSCALSQGRGSLGECLTFSLVLSLSHFELQLPMNEAMFSGSVALEEAIEEKRGLGGTFRRRRELDWQALFFPLVGIECFTSFSDIRRLACALTCS